MSKSVERSAYDNYYIVHYDNTCFPLICMGPA